MTRGGPDRRRYELCLWMDRRLGPPLCALLLGLAKLRRRRPAAAAPGAVRSILVLKFWGMGSIVLATPLLERLRARHPQARIDFVSLSGNRALLELLPGLGRIFSLDLSGGPLRFAIQTLRTLRTLRRERYDLLLDLEFLTRFSAIFSFLCRPRRSHGFSARGSLRGRLHDLEIPFDESHHVALGFEALLGGRPTQREVPRLPLLRAPAEAWRSCEALLAGEPAWRGDRPMLVLNPNAGEMALERRWPLERCAELLGRLGREREIDLVLIGAPDERSTAEAVARRSGTPERIANLAGRLELSQLVALLARADLVVTNDSGPMHLAAAAGTPVVALFGPETPELYGPLASRPGQGHRVHYRGLACSPCMSVHDNKVLSCRFARARCMSGIEPRAVLASVDALLPPPSTAGLRAAAR